ncbi:2Fe-2S iron-sulfur cluster binding domain family protein [Candida parapsilosis]|uniref:2Fe-2S ferredoxin-type domain-containing protein n=2 Tax=Candida parapsilosis TaxID=5480 RepID=G8B771_CANPC|nr:uncharacterized protein CPAR2_103420 [Candida parapsilosis]KAF6048284.1 2Fe-2S iron-sulfur cluster binding domain family protein [Candida parapsilosis]KAF6049750.1 2Fe-2S iron-sulfur cluster binding domain family protein [Candida parapsilosis]KAF6057612.1 2Fe-2S iron-sulfur cluster binding domain family protein [Candida parapsilosis]KAF6065680.1 2Fe-2S iron-sulfur cluster binding domain family protein [Candida parapsilosis]KAI5904581.1 Adrenodoxin [Candida parapsilosis]
MIRSIFQRQIRGIHYYPFASTSQSLINCKSFVAAPFFKSLHTSPILSHGHLHTPKPGEELHITFITKDGNQYTYEVAEGDNILDIAQAHNLDMEGACGGSCACSTCHVIVDPEFYDEIPEPSDDENDMLDLAFGLTETSRLGCQVKMSKELDGIRVALPAMTRNLQNKDFN